MEGEREGDLRVPVISSLFFLVVITGGVFLILYVFVPEFSQPWFPIAAFILIGSPWLFWLTTYLYTCFKSCFGATRIDDRQVSQRGHHAPPRTPTPKMARKESINVDSPAVDSPSGGERHVRFGAVVVMEGEERTTQGKNGNNEGDSSVASSKECEMPLALSH